MRGFFFVFLGLLVLLLIGFSFVSACFSGILVVFSSGCDSSGGSGNVEGGGGSFAGVSFTCGSVFGPGSGGNLLGGGGRFLLELEGSAGSEPGGGGSFVLVLGA